MVVLGLTGSIGMGKTVAGKMFTSLGVPVYDADAEVHRLLGPGGAGVAPVAAVFSGIVKAGPRGEVIDRTALGARVFGDPPALRRLEAILHPMVSRAQRRFVATAARRRLPLVVLDVPLLFEVGRDKDCDATMVVSAPRFIQYQRVMRRPGMTPEKLGHIRASQMPDAEKRRRADFVVPTGLDRALTLRRIAAIVKMLRSSGGRNRPGKRLRAKHG